LKNKFEREPYRPRLGRTPWWSLTNVYEYRVFVLFCSGLCLYFAVSGCGPGINILRATKNADLTRYGDYILAPLLSHSYHSPTPKARNRKPHKPVLRKFHHIHDRSKVDMNCLLCLIGGLICLAVGFFLGCLVKEKWATENRHEVDGDR